MLELINYREWMLWRYFLRAEFYPAIKEPPLIVGFPILGRSAQPCKQDVFVKLTRHVTISKIY
jgi:hypothetical protein